MMIMMVNKELIKDPSYFSDWSNLFRLAISTCKYEQISTGKCEQITTCKYEKNIKKGWNTLRNYSLSIFKHCWSSLSAIHWYGERENLKRVYQSIIIRFISNVMAQTSNFLSPSVQKITFSDLNVSSEVLVKSDNLNTMNKMPRVVQPVALKTQRLLTIILQIVIFNHDFMELILIYLSPPSFDIELHGSRLMTACLQDHFLFSKIAGGLKIILSSCSHGIKLSPI